MNKPVLFLLSCLLVSGLTQSADMLPEALTYCPTISNQTNAIVNVAGLATAAATFWVLHQIKREGDLVQAGHDWRKIKDKGALYELCALAFSPFKAILSAIGIEAKSIEYPSAQSYFNLAVAAISGYLAAKFAFTFTPEGKFTAAQSDLKEIINNPKAQKLITDQENLLNNINRAFVEKDRPIVAGHTYLLNIRTALKNVYNKLAGVVSIQDATAQKYLADMERAALHQIEGTEASLVNIKQSPGWESALKAAQEAADRAQELFLQRRRINCEEDKAWAMHRQADATYQLAKNKHHPRYGHHSKTACAYPPAR